MKKKTEVQTQPKQPLSSFEGTFIGNGTDNNENLITRIKENPLFRASAKLEKDFFKANKVDNNKFVFDLNSANLVIYLTANEGTLKLGTSSIKSLMDIKLCSCSQDVFDDRMREKLFSCPIVHVLHTPAKPFQIVGEDSMYEIVDEVYIREILTEVTK